MGNPTPPLKVQCLSPKEMVDMKSKGLCYNYDEKYVKGHWCIKQILFHMDVSLPVMVDEVSPEAPSEDEAIE